MNNLIIIKLFVEGGWIMWPIFVTSLVTVSVVIERIFWWRKLQSKRDPRQLDRVYAALEKHDIKEAASLTSSSEDPLLRVIWYGLNHYHSSLQGALQVSAGIELERAGRFIVVLDTIVTLAPLLGLLGTVTGLMKAFFKLGDAELSEQAIGGGIAEALIATACGLTIAVVSLIFLNYFSAKVAKLQFDLQTSCTNVELLLGAPAAKEPIPIHS
jgi:biopolymer transport protein ExbB